ncbi:MAG: tyrosine-type recombinase/integrase [Pseudomonadota bacterium]
MPVINLTEARIRSLPLGSGIYRDEQAKGLMVICHRTTKTYAVQGDVRRNGRHVRTVRVKIDRVDRIGLREARRRAREIMSTIQSGVDPTARPAETGMTLAEAYDAHLAERELRPVTVRDYRYHIEKYLRTLRRRAVADISRADVREVYERIRTNSGQTTASGVMRSLRAVINTARRIDETIGPNPVEAVRFPAPKPRTVAPLDLERWWDRTGRLGPARRDLHRAMMLTGARKTSVLTLERGDVDAENGVVNFRHMKTHGEMLFPAGPFLVEMLRIRMEDDEPLRSEWLWPSATSSSGHVVNAREQGLPSPHEYRHHARTLLIAAGVPYAESALLLGHKLPGATGSYVHPEHLVEHLRPWAERFEALVLARCGVGSSSQRRTAAG